jgi:hypothetical protein
VQEEPGSLGTRRELSMRNRVRYLYIDPALHASTDTFPTTALPIYRFSQPFSHRFSQPLLTLQTLFDLIFWHLTLAAHSRLSFLSLYTLFATFSSCRASPLRLMTRLTPPPCEWRLE